MIGQSAMITARRSRGEIKGGGGKGEVRLGLAASICKVNPLVVVANIFRTRVQTSSIWLYKPTLSHSTLCPCVLSRIAFLSFSKSVRANDAIFRCLAFTSLPAFLTHPGVIKRKKIDIMFLLPFCHKTPPEYVLWYFTIYFQRFSLSTRLHLVSIMQLDASKGI